MIEINHVSKSFDNGKTHAVKNVSLVIQQGEILVILGSSGSGKSTLLKMLNRLVEPVKGTIKIDNEDIALKNPVLLRRLFGYVFQGVGLFPHLNVEENIAIVLRILNVSKQEQSKKAHQLLTLVNLDPLAYAHRYPDELSGGEQQRIGVARALASDPEYLLMDEPFGALDAITRNDLQQEVLRLNQQLKKTIVFVTHDIMEAIRISDRIAIMHEGELVQIGTHTEIREHPKTEFVRELFEKFKDQFNQFIDETS